MWRCQVRLYSPVSVYSTSCWKSESTHAEARAKAEHVAWSQRNMVFNDVHFNVVTFWHYSYKTAQRHIWSVFFLLFLVFVSLFLVLTCCKSLILILHFEILEGTQTMNVLILPDFWLLLWWILFELIYYPWCP